MEAKQLAPDALFTQYIDVVNRAIAANKDEIPFKQLLSVGEKILGDKRIGVEIYKTDPKYPHDYFTLTYSGKELHATHGKDAPDIGWKVKEEHLQHVVDDPDTFIEHPTKLDLDWLKTRLSSIKS
ncbi:hypothetical protein ENSA5_69370 [Enhygromyxa salina]|uniref:Uncharacterized protein n=1 Tax=Enhygromyxa salina TaxID=215803 RepID=A0A2S9XAV9_9BACT|nr:hypothetical protein [Enhygromyxa salina]PRP89994.1 hypothetical protein ENSA5_69370 [Enhygromyxa salina]